MKIKKPKVAILLAACNGEDFISEQLKSILNQSIYPSKIFISIDKSKDQTLKIVKKFKSKFKNINIVSNNHKFGSSFLNFIFLINLKSLKKYDFIALSDQDDIWKKNKIKFALDQLNKKKIDCYSSDVIAFWKNGKKKIIKKSYNQREYDYFFEAGGPGCTYVMKTNFVLKFQLFLRKNFKKIKNLNNYHDWLIYFFARVNKFKWLIDERVTVNYRQHNNNLIGANIGVKSKINRVKLLLNGQRFEYIAKIINLNNIENHKFVKKWFPYSIKGFIFLFINSKKCRRKLSEQIYFSIICLIMIIKFLILGKVYQK
jgi:rhamnosyltransferase